MHPSEKQHGSKVRIYQVGFELGAPLLVSAFRPEEAALVARIGSNDRATLAIDVTDQFAQLSHDARLNTDMFVASGKLGIVEYDEDRGWVLVGRAT